MPPASSNLTLCSRCKYPIELAIAPDTQATCPECGTVNTGTDFIRRAERRTARRRTLLVVAIFLAVHISTIVLLARFANSFMLLRAIPPFASILAASLATVLSALAGGTVLFKLTKPVRVDALLPAYVAFYVPTLFIVLAYAVVLSILDTLRR